MLVKVLNESLEVVDSFNISFLAQIQLEAEKRISSGSVKIGYFFRSGDTFWRVVEVDKTLTIEIDAELTDEAKRVTEYGSREKAPIAPALKPIPQWLFPQKLFDTPQSAFDFPEYPGLSVAMRLYVVVGKVAYSIGFVAILLSSLVVLGSFIESLQVSELSPAYPGIAGMLLFFLLLLLNLGLALQFASCEIVKVLIRIENNTRKETVKDRGDE